MTRQSQAFHFALRLTGALALGLTAIVKSHAIQSTLHVHDGFGTSMLVTGVPILDRVEVLLIATCAIWIALGIRTRVVASFAGVYCLTHFIWVIGSDLQGAPGHLWAAALFLAACIIFAALGALGGGSMALVRRGWSGF